MGGHVARTIKMKNACRILVGTPEEEIPFNRLTGRLENACFVIIALHEFRSPSPHPPHRVYAQQLCP
jgi:hypothetical protein